MDTIPQFVGERVFESGISLPAGQGRVAFALRSDMGEAIANALLTEDWKDTIYHLTGNASSSFGDVAVALTRLSNRSVTYRPTEASAFANQMLERGVSEVIVQRVVGFMTDIKNGQEDQISPDLERLLGRKPTSLEQGLKALYKL